MNIYTLQCSSVEAEEVLSDLPGNSRGIAVQASEFLPKFYVQCSEQL